MLQDILHKGNVSLDAPDMKPIQGPQHLDPCFVKVLPFRTALDKQGVKVRGDLVTRIDVAIEPNPGTTRRVIGHYPPGIRHEVILRVFRRNPALNGGTVKLQVRLLR